jgi:hypothetical protein
MATEPGEGAVATADDEDADDEDADIRDLDSPVQLSG